jgi:hypothetical protein
MATDTPNAITTVDLSAAAEERFLNGASCTPCTRACG